MTPAPGEEPQFYNRRHPVDEAARKVARIWTVRHPADAIDTEVDDAIRELATCIAVVDRMERDFCDVCAGLFESLTRVAWADGHAQVCDDCREIHVDAEGNWV